ncbi:MAG: hypothetical protein KJ795_09125 [Gammaproteobacteria bacterium]|nr:hypothetical protein [Gammaproteobacteria bacterium]MBU1777951.1 hypothetical protein [Gammaproteobacteria bacterium]MBU1970152.1 hypothetical protein [Gammaproteobacteria bacterium]
MSKQNGMMKRIVKLSLILMMGASMSACSDSWKEEVLLHDGQKIIVKRAVEHGGRHELFQSPPISEQRLEWEMPGTGETIIWEDHFSQDVGSATLLPMLVDVHQGNAYVVANPTSCLAYNKWGRPNPPYVIFKHEGREWKRIPLQELPSEIRTPNLILSSPDEEAKQIGKNPVPAEAIQRIVRETFQPEYKSILREPVTKGSGGTSCAIPTTVAQELIAPKIDGVILRYNWWPLAQDWLEKKYGSNR